MLGVLGLLLEFGAEFFIIHATVKDQFFLAHDVAHSKNRHQDQVDDDCGGRNRDQ